MSKLIGKRFERLIVIQRTDNDKWRHSRWLCQCDCGNEIIVLGYDLKRGHTKSCGCLQKEQIIKSNTKHGHAKRGKITGFYKSWYHMIQRCTNPNNKDWKDYGGRGITVCKRWRNSFSDFLEDMGECPKGLTLGRIDNDKGYYKKNCKWAINKEQARNKQNSLFVPHNREKRLLIELCEEHNMPYRLVYERIYRSGWTVKEALTTPVKKYKTKRKNG